MKVKSNYRVEKDNMKGQVSITSELKEAKSLARQLDKTLDSQQQRVHNVFNDWEINRVSVSLIETPDDETTAEQDLTEAEFTEAVKQSEKTPASNGNTLHIVEEPSNTTH